MDTTDQPMSSIRPDSGRESAHRCGKCAGGPGATAVIRRFATVVLLPAVIGSAGCGNEATGPARTVGQAVMTSRTADQPALVVQYLDGTSRVRIRFDGVADDIPGNLPSFLLPVRDATIRALGPVRWSPDGSMLAVVVTVAPDQSQIVVMNADGTDMRAASPNTQVILSDIAWSPDGETIAYAMSTIAGAGAIALFTTTISENSVKQLTTANLAGAGIALAWAANGSAVLYSQIRETGPGPLFEVTSEVKRIDVTTLQETTIDAAVPGEVFGISTDGVWALLVRTTTFVGSDPVEEVVRRSLVNGMEILLTPVPEVIAWAAITGGETDVLITTPLPGGQLRYRRVPANGGEEEFLDTIDGVANSVDIRPR